MADPDEGKQLPGTAYRLKRKLGAGGMGTVWIAEHIDLGRNDAVKLLAAQLLDDPDAFERLKREARATAQLGNPHIIDIYTMGLTTDGMPYVAMRLVQGPNLRELLQREPHMPVARAWGLMRPICLALQDAHEARIVHRDLKPENIMVETRRGEAFPVILDFGIAKSLLETEQRITREGDVVGTPGYMAPEQALGRDVDGRADQYSVAVMLYELVSTQLPVTRGGPLQMIAQQITQPPRRLREFVSAEALPDDAEAVIMRALDRNRTDRFDDLNAFVEAMDAALVGLWTPPRGTVEYSGPVPPRVVSEAAQAFGQAATGVLPQANPTPPSAPAASTMTPSPSTPVRARPRWLWIAGGVLVSAVGAAVAFVSTSSEVETPSGPTSVAPSAPQQVVVAPAAAVPPATQPSAAPATAAPTSSAPVSAPPASPSARGTSPPTRRVAGPASEARAPTPPSEAPPPPLSRPSAEPTAPPTSAPVVAAPVPTTAAPTAAPPIERPVRPRVVASSKVQGGASTAELKRALQQIERRAQTCIGALPGLAVGQAAQIDFGVDGDGFFTAPVVAGEPALARCLSGAVKGVSRLERRPDTGEVRVRYELRLEAP
jgi:serine/threonine-protein kinase